MACYSPLHAYKGKSKDASKMSIVFRRPDSWKGEKLDLPCGQCVGCRLERSRQWAVRCMHEASLYDDNSFLTLTYSSENLPSNGSLPKYKGGDLQLFFKRLRKSIAPKRVRYYACGEYGENLGRPHYHALLFGHEFEDKKIFSAGKNPLYTSDSLSKLWPFGFAVSGAVTFESAAYVARYVMKKISGSGAAEHYAGRVPEFTVMSRRPGIGARWYEKFKTDVHDYDRIVVRGYPSRPPRFYDNLLGVEDPARLAWLKIEREKNSKHFVTDTLSNGRVIRVSDQDMCRLAVKEEIKKAEIKNLIRPLEDN